MNARVEIIQKAQDEWRQSYDPAGFDATTMAEFVEIRLRRWEDERLERTTQYLRNSGGIPPSPRAEAVLAIFRGDSDA